MTLFENQGRAIDIQLQDNGDVIVEGDPIAVRRFMEATDMGARRGYRPHVVSDRKVLYQYIVQIGES